MYLRKQNKIVAFCLLPSDFMILNIYLYKYDMLN